MSPQSRRNSTSRGFGVGKYLYTHTHTHLKGGIDVNWTHSLQRDVIQQIYQEMVVTISTSGIQVD